MDGWMDGDLPLGSLPASPSIIHPSMDGWVMDGEGREPRDKKFRWIQMGFQKVDFYFVKAHFQIQMDSDI